MTYFSSWQPSSIHRNRLYIWYTSKLSTSLWSQLAPLFVFFSFHITITIPPTNPNTAYTKSSLFALRFSPDWESVQRHTRRAIESFKFCGDEAWAGLLETYPLAVEAFEHTGLYQQCGIYSDEAGDLCVKVAEQEQNKDKAATYWTKSIAFFTKSAKYFRLSNHVDRNAAILLKASESYLKLDDRDNAIALIEKSCSIYDDDFKLINAEKYFSQAFGVLMRLQEYQRAIQWLQYQIKTLANRKDMYKNTIHNNLTEELILLLFIEKYKAADIRLQQMIDGDEYDFLHSQQYMGVRDLIQACNNLDNPDAIQECRQKNTILKYIDRNVALLIPKLKQNVNAPRSNNGDGDDEDEDGEKKDGKTAAVIAQQTSSEATADDLL